MKTVMMLALLLMPCLVQAQTVPAKIVFFGSTSGTGTVNFSTATDPKNALFIDVINQLSAADPTGGFALILTAQNATVTPTSVTFNNVAGATPVPVMTIDCLQPNQRPLCNVLNGAVQLHIPALDTVMRNAHMVITDAGGTVLFQ